MPTYEYACRTCDHRFEQFQSISAPKIQICPACGLKKVERLISAGGGIVFKGSGFYATDYRDPPPKSSEREQGSGEGTGDKKNTAEGGKKTDGSQAPGGAKPSRADKKS